MADQPKQSSPPLPAVVLAGLVANLGATLLIGKLIEHPLNAPADSLDDSVGALARDSQNPVLTPVMGLMSAAAEPWVLYPLSGLLAARWLAEDRAEDAATLGLALLGSAGVSELIKPLVQRRRPRFRIHQTRTSGSSFPSQHITMSVATYGTIAFLVNRRRRRQGKPVRGWRAWAPVALLCSLIGWSRVYQGVHHPTDVLGGLVAGGLWLTTCGVACNCLAPTTTGDSPRAPDASR